MGIKHDIKKDRLARLKVSVLRNRDISPRKVLATIIVNGQPYCVGQDTVRRGGISSFNSLTVMEGLPKGGLLSVELEHS